MEKGYNENNNEELSIEEMVARLKATIEEEEREAAAQRASESKKSADELSDSISELEKSADESNGGVSELEESAGDFDDGVPDSDEALRRFIQKYTASEGAEDGAETVMEDAAALDDEAHEPVAEAKDDGETVSHTAKRFRFTRSVKLRPTASEAAEEAVEAVSEDKPADEVVEKADDDSFEMRAEETPAEEEATLDTPISEPVQLSLDFAEDAENDGESIEDAESIEEDAALEDAVVDVEDVEDVEENSSKRDIALMRALGMEVGDDSEYFDEDTDDTVPNETVFEYTSPSQNKEIMAGLSKEFKSSRIRLIAGAVLAFLLLLLEGLPAIGADLPGPFSLYNYPAVYALVDLQLFVLCAALVYVQLFVGAKNLFEGFATSESLSFVIASITLLASVITNIAGVTSSLTVYCFPAALCMLMTAAFEYMNLKRDVMSFNVVSSNRPKHAVGIGDYSTDRREVDSVIDLEHAEDAKVLKVTKTGFISDFFERSRSGGRENNVNIILISIALAAMIAFFIVGTVKGGFINGLAVANATMLFCLPVTVFFSNAYPLMRASERALDSDCAIIGASAVDEYSDASLVVFDDKDVFPAKGIRVRSVKIYDNNRIDQVLYWTTSVFSVAKGPLTEVLLNATVELGHSNDVTLDSVSEDGIDAIVDGSRVLCGSEQFLSDYGIYPTYDPEDDALLRNADAGILFIVRDGMICAKFYISYSVDAEFESVLKRLYGAGVCAVIKTYDPNINDGLLGRAIKLSRYPVKIVRCTAEQSQVKESEKMSSGIVTKSSVKNLLNTIVMCQNLRNIFRTNAIIKIAAVAVSLIIMLLTVIFGKTVPSMLVALYQLIWILPTLLTMKLYLK